MCHTGLKGAEVTYTALCARSLDRFLFDDNDSNVGACLHQFPVDKRDGSSGVPVADMCVVKLIKDLPHAPMLVCDLKTTDFPLAVNETACYAVKSMRAGHDIQDFTVQLGFAGTKDSFQLLVFSVGESSDPPRVLFKMNICTVQVGDTNGMKALFSVLFGAVHHLIRYPISMENTAIAPLRDVNLSPLVDNGAHERVLVTESKVV